MTLTMNASSPTASRRWLRTAGAFVAGFATVAILSIGTDAVLHAANFYPNDGTTGGDGALAVALGYRTLFTVLGGFVAAWLAPANKLRLAIILGAVGTLFAILGAVATWSVGHNWYPVALAVLALPSTTLGSWLFTCASR